MSAIGRKQSFRNHKKGPRLVNELRAFLLMMAPHRGCISNPLYRAAAGSTGGIRGYPEIWHCGLIPSLRQLREAQKIGLRKFTQMVGMSPTYLSKVERDEFKPPTEKKVRAIAKALGQNPDELLALAGRVSSDLADIIQRQPREMATFLRAANSLSAEEMQKLSDEAQRLKKEEGT
jgi:transcriptional regulator with XRE-family HTH domain